MDNEKIKGNIINLSTNKVKRESTKVEYKESIGKNSYWKITKAILGFSNNKGGLIVIGITDSPRKIKGISPEYIEKEFENYQHILNNLYGDQIQYELKTLEIGEDTLGIIEVHEANNKPVICNSNEGDLKTGAIYYRYTGESTCIKPAELNKIILEIRQKESEKWQKLFKTIVSAGINNITTLNLQNGQIGDAGKFYVDSRTLEDIKNNFSFIEEGNFAEKDGEGIPTLKLIGEIIPSSVVVETKGGYDNDKYRYTVSEIAQKLGINKYYIKRLIAALGYEDDEEYYTEIKYCNNYIRKYTEKCFEDIDKLIPKDKRSFTDLKELYNI